VNPGRLLGVDYGNVRIGLAVCDADWRIATPLEQYTRRNPVLDAEFFVKLVAREDLSAAVVGIPMDTDGGENNGTFLCRTFGEWLKNATGLDVFYFDERCTTVAAEEMLWAAGLRHKERKARRDKLAATLILQAFIDNARDLLSETEEP
jgi:putative Holliday junction resolvase